MSGTLYLCATPIGNLKDITLRALDTLRSADLILAEDTRHTIKLLNHYEITTPMQPYHAHNEYQAAERVLAQLHGGKQIALVSDAGSPLVSDPGSGLVSQARDQGITVTVIPGASAVLTALIGSGLLSTQFAFIGFLPRQSKERRAYLQRYQNFPDPLVCFEAPHRLTKALEDLLQVMGNRSACLCRELTKKYEQYRHAPLEELLSWSQQEEIRGEITLVIAGNPEPTASDAPWSDERLQTRYQSLLDEGLHSKEALRQLVTESGQARNTLYTLLVK